MKHGILELVRSGLAKGLSGREEAAGYAFETWIRFERVVGAVMIFVVRNGQFLPLTLR